MKSIRLYLTTTLLFSLLIAFVLSALWSYRDAAHETEELFDAELAQTARILQGLAASHLTSEALEELSRTLIATPVDSDSYRASATLRHKYEKKLALQIWSPAGELLLQSPAWGGHSPLPQQEGLHWERHSDQTWRTLTLFDRATGVWIKVGQHAAIRQELTREIALHSTLPYLALFPLLAIVIGMVVNRGLQPLARLSREVSQRTPGNLAPVAQHPLPLELTELAQSINDLLQRLHTAFQRERQFTSDAAHELRTPLAALQIHCQNAARADDPHARQQSLDKLLTGIQRMTHVVTQLLTLSRLDHQPALTERSLIPLYPTVAELIGELYPFVQKKSQTIELHGCEECCIQAAPASLDILVRNLLDNALRYTPAHGRIEVIISADDAHCTLRLRDTGPGIPPAQLAKVFERFYRGEGQTESGSGLGLAIARQLAQQLQATLTLDNRRDRSGLEVCVTFPRAAG